MLIHVGGFASRLSRLLLLLLLLLLSLFGSFVVQSSVYGLDDGWTIDGDTGLVCEKKKKKKKRMRWSHLATTDRAVRHTQNHAPKFLSFVDDDVFSLWNPNASVFL
jgi:hypothetical protein